MSHAIIRRNLTRTSRVHQYACRVHPPSLAQLGAWLGHRRTLFNNRFVWLPFTTPWVFLGMQRIFYQSKTT